MAAASHVGDGGDLRHARCVAELSPTPIVPPAEYAWPPMADGFHPPLEEYLEAIWELEEEGVQVIQARLAEHLGHSAPSVSEMVRRLRTDGYVAARRPVAQPHRQGPGPGRERGPQAPAGRAPAHRRHRHPVAQDPRGGVPVGARDLRRGRGAAGRPARQPRHLPPRQPHPRRRRAGPRSCRRWPTPSPATTSAWSGSPSRSRSTWRPSSTSTTTASSPAPAPRCASKAPDGTLTLTLDEGTIALGPGLASQLFVAKHVSRTLACRRSAGM